MKKSEIDLLLSVLLIFAIFLSITGFLTDISNTVKFGGVDLRNRVVGARLLIDKQNPYYYKWKEGDSTLFLDPRDNPDWEVNRVTVPPTVLMFHTSFSWLSYKIQRYLWLFLQWFLLLGSIFFFSKSSGSKTKSKLIWICGLFFVGSSFFWRLHVERGQIYILYVFIIALSYWVYTKKKNHSEIWSGIIAGIAMSLRPPLIVLSFPMLIYKRINFIVGNIIGIIVGIGSTFLIATSNTWLNYYTAMKAHGIIHFNLNYLSSFRYPYQNIEDVSNLWILADIPISDTSLQYLFTSVGLNLTSNALLILLVLTILISFIVIKKVRESIMKFNAIFYYGIILVLHSEFFIPAARYSYNNIWWLLILSLTIINSKEILSLLKK